MTDNLKILLVEDNQFDAGLIQHELIKSRLSFTFEVVQTRSEFEDSLLHFIPDIILSDYSLPSFGGLTAFYISQGILPDIPFIIVSGTIGEELAVELIKNGVTDYTLKDKLFTLIPKINRGLKDAQEKKEKRITDEKLKTQCKNLYEIAFMQSHQVRVPVAQILGLFNIFNFDDPTDHINTEVLTKLKLVAESLDKIIHEIVKKTNEVESEMADHVDVTDILN